MDFEEYISWISGMSMPDIHCRNMQQFIELHADPEKLGSAEYIIDVNHERGVIRKEDKLPPDYDPVEFDVSFEDHVLSVTNEFIKNSFQKIESPYTETELPKLLNKWQHHLASAEKNVSSYKYFVKFPMYQKALKLLNSEIRRISAKWPDNIITEAQASKVRPHNFKGELSEKCIEDLRSYRIDKPDLGQNEFFKSAYNRFTSCRYTLKVVEGKNKQIKISWATLRNKVKESHPEILQRKN